MTNFFDNNYQIAEQNLTLRQGDRLPSLVAQIVDEFDIAVDLTGYDINASLRRESSGFGGGDWQSYLPVSVLDRINGVVSYDWQGSDTSSLAPGRYELTMVLIDVSSIKITVPTERNAYVTIRSRIIPD